MSYLIKLTNTLVFQIFKRGTTCTLIPYCTKCGAQALKVRNRGGCKNHKNISFLTSTIHFIYNTFYSQNIQILQRGSCGVPQMFMVLIPSLCITNPLTLNLPPSFWVILSFTIPSETIKRGGDFIFNLYKVQSIQWLSLEHFYRYRKMATSLRKD